MTRPTTPNAPATSSDPLSGLQWDMVQIRAPEAHAVTGGSRSVVVGDIDTGLDFTHPDLAPNVDFANSVSCVGGTPNTAPSAWNDDNGHGGSETTRRVTNACVVIPVEIPGVIGVTADGTCATSPTSRATASARQTWWLLAVTGASRGPRQRQTVACSPRTQRL